MKRILVDMDGVLADTNVQFLNWEFKETGILRDIKEIYGKAESEAFPYFEKHIHTKGFFGTLPVIKDSIKGLEYLNNKYDVVILSSATEYPQSLTEKELWLNEFFSFIDWTQIVFCGRKDLVPGDIMIDDHPKNLNIFNGEKIIFTQPHNIELSMSDCKRVSSWNEIMKIL